MVIVITTMVKMLTSFDNNSRSDGGCQNHSGANSGTGKNHWKQNMSSIKYTRE